MKVVILAGGKGTRLSEETVVKPKPMVEIGDKPILWHIMKHYQHYGFDNFYIACGYKGDLIKQYFLFRHQLQDSMAVGPEGVINYHDGFSDEWTVHLINTGQETMTGGRVLRLKEHLKNEPFMVTYGDGLSNVDIARLLLEHRDAGKLVTLTAVRPLARFGGLKFFDGGQVRFTEKSQANEGWINGGFMVCEPGVFDYLEGDDSILERELLERLAEDNQLAAYRHYGFWQCMDTLREKHILEELWASGNPPWKTWEE